MTPSADPLKSLQDDIAVRRMIAVHRNDDAMLLQIDEEERELNLLRRPAVKSVHPPLRP